MNETLKHSDNSIQTINEKLEQDLVTGKFPRTKNEDYFVTSRGKTLLKVLNSDNHKGYTFCGMPSCVFGLVLFSASR